MYINLYITGRKGGTRQERLQEGEVMASLMQRPGSPVYYIQYYLCRKMKRVSTGTDVLQLAKEKLRQYSPWHSHLLLDVPSETQLRQ